MNRYKISEVSPENNSLMLFFIRICKSFLEIRNRNSPGINPCGTPNILKAQEGLLSVSQYSIIKIQN